MIALVDYGAGNLTSVRKALDALGASFWTPTSPDEVARAAGIIVPGVGHFSATSALDAPWRTAILEAVNRSMPLLGICVGLQWLFEGSTEAPEVPGLGLMAGRCTLLSDGQAVDHELRSKDGGKQQAIGRRLKVPHVGWNSLAFPKPSRLFEGLVEGTQVYFTHSYAAPVVAATAAITVHGMPFSAAVEDGLVAGVQIHPEKSGDAGLRILRNWLTEA